MKKLSQIVNEVSTSKLVDYVAKASQDVGRRIEKNEPGVESFRKTLKRSGKIGRAMAHIKLRANESNDMCNVCGQTPCNCTHIDEGRTVGDHIKKAVSIYFKHRNLEDRASYRGDKAARDKHRAGAKKASALLAKMRAKQAAADADKPKPVEVPHDYSAAIAQDYKDQEKRRGIGHVRDSVELEGNPVNEISQELKNRYVERAVTAHGGYNMARRNTTGKVKEYFARKEANTKKGIARALRKEDVGVEESLGTSPDRLAARQGINIAHKFPRKGQTDMRNIPVGNMVDKYKQSMDSQRANRSSLLKKAIKDQLGKHRSPNLPEEIEQVDELKRSTLASYIVKSSTDKTNRAMDAMDRAHKGQNGMSGMKKIGARNMGITRAARRLAKEEVEQVNELSKDTLHSYMVKARKDKKDRKPGIMKAWKKSERMTMEDVEQVNELSKGTIERYKSYGVLRQVRHAADIYDREVEGGKSPDPKQHAALAKSKKNLERANARLAKEDIEQVSELKTSTLLRYTTKATRSADKLGGAGGQAIDSGDRATAAKMFTKRDNRFKGIMKARAKIQANAKKK